MKINYIYTDNTTTYTTDTQNGMWYTTISI